MFPTLGVRYQRSRVPQRARTLRSGGTLSRPELARVVLDEIDIDDWPIICEATPQLAVRRRPDSPPSRTRCRGPGRHRLVRQLGRLGQFDETATSQSAP